MNTMRNAAYQYLDAEPVAGAMGAVISGIDLSQELPDAVLAEIRAALLEHQVIFFRNQSLTPERQLAFARRWGEIHLHPFMAGMEEHPEVLRIVKTPADKTNFGGSWHTDQMFSPKPAMGTILYAVQVPSAGGDTLFASMYRAHDALSPGLKRMLADVRVIARGDNFKGHDGKSRKDYFADKLSMTVKDPGNVQTVSSHPLIRTHPETGRKALFIGGHVHQFEDMTEDDSAPLIDLLMKHATKPEFTCRFSWEPGSLAFWDNRCVQHFAINDYPAETRIMHRITVCGDTPY